MICEFCKKQWVDDKLALTNYLLHKIVFHGGDLD
tara:strand:- start:408 stop:509 length:102 start_codon:yes stop_codon:yes gene_type:complete